MKIEIFIILIAYSLLLSCSNSTEKNIKSFNPDSSINKKTDVNKNKSTNLEDLNLKELKTLSQSISQRYIKNHRSWKYNQPERWNELSNYFADEVIEVNPHAKPHKEEIAKIYLNYLKNRSGVYSSDVKNKKELMQKLAAGFKYDLSFLIGLKAYNDWQNHNKVESKTHKETGDSLRMIFELQMKKIATKMKNHE